MYFSGKFPKRTLMFQNCFLEIRHQTWDFRGGLWAIICTYAKYTASEIIMFASLRALNALTSPFSLAAYT